MAFVYVPNGIDMRNWSPDYEGKLDTLPRIFSFIVLGALLVGVSWVYTRFREQVQRYL